MALPGCSELTHRDRVTHICVSKLIIAGSNNGLSPGRYQAIIWTNAGILLIESLGKNQWNLNRNSYSCIQENPFENVVCQNGDHCAQGWDELSGLSTWLWIIQYPWQTSFFNSSPPEQNGRHFADDAFRCIFVNESLCISIQSSLKFVPKGQIDKKSALVQVMAWRLFGAKPLPEPMLTQFTDAYMRH